METSATYIMHPNLFVQLSFVRGFNGMNGDTYQDHILIVLEELLNEEQKKTIRTTRTPDDALKALTDMGIHYTHEFSDVE